MRTAVYVDAFNLYYGCLRHPNRRWLNLGRLCELELPGIQIERIRYFTAHVKPTPADPSKHIRQQVYLRALRTLKDLTIHLGRYSRNKEWMELVTPASGGPASVQVWRNEEKGSDVNLGCYLVLDGCRGLYDRAVVISNDTDLEEPVRLVVQELGLPVVTLHPCRHPRVPSARLSRWASGWQVIDDANIVAAQFPVVMTDTAGTFHKPVAW
jgi:hypothetical protein